jgi:hypothetical protein
VLSFSVSVQRAWNFEEFFEFAAAQLDLKAFETESKHQQSQLLREKSQ